NGLPEAVEKIQNWNPHGIILDLALRGGQSGIDLLADLRKESSVPSIMLSGYSDEDVRIRALTLGADDFVIKPFSPGELMARLQTVFRRAPNPDTLEFADLTLERATHRVLKA